MSLDGFIAGPNGEYDWIPADPDFDFAELFARFDTLLMGRRTWEVAQAFGHGSIPGKTTVVVSRTLRPEDHPGLTIVASDLRGAVEKLKARTGTDIWLYGGSALFGSLLELGLVDTVETAVMPVLIGRGIPLQPPTDTRTRLRLTGRKISEKSGIVLLEYAIDREVGAARE